MNSRRSFLTGSFAVLAGVALPLGRVVSESNHDNWFCLLGTSMGDVLLTSDSPMLLNIGDTEIRFSFTSTHHELLSIERIDVYPRGYAKQPRRLRINYLPISILPKDTINVTYILHARWGKFAEEAMK
jgi:hypothetical protein